MAQQQNAWIEVAKSLNGLFGFAFSSPYDHAVYQVTISFPVGATVGTQRDGSFVISRDSAFFCSAIVASARRSSDGRWVGIGNPDGGAAGVDGPPDAPFLVQIKDGGSGRQLHDAPVDCGLVYNPMRDGGRLARPKLFRPGSTVSVEASALKVSAASGFDLRLAFLGVKFYDLANLRQTVGV